LKSTNQIEFRPRRGCSGSKKPAREVGGGSSDMGYGGWWRPAPR
jgi:hypothetical protein